jgi:hypothetical protein
MRQDRRWSALARSVLLAGGLLSGGCLSFVHPLAPPGPADLLPCDGVPAACKNRVHLFFIGGIDPLDLGNLDGLCNYAHALGFIKTHVGAPYHAFYFEKEILRIHKADPDARFVLLGFSWGAGLARDVAAGVGARGVPTDLLVYIDGVTLAQKPLDRPATALHVVNLLSCGRDPAGHKVEHATNVQYDDAGHFGAPTHPQTRKMLANELAVVALRVPLVEVAPPPAHPEFIPPRPVPERLPAPLPAPERLPAPKPTPERLPPPKPEKPTAARGDWDFLLPDGSSTGYPGGQPMAEAAQMPAGPAKDATPGPVAPPSPPPEKSGSPKR